jgi:two-component system sensor histidine kinase BaeS
MERTMRRWSVTVPREWRVRSLAAGWVMADRERLELAVDSLIENAVRFTTESEMVALGSAEDGDHLVIQVVDTGVGIAADRLPHVFDRFARADASRDRGSGGTGLGLAIVKAVVDAHGGTVEVTSDPGHLTTFTVRLPGFRGSPVRHDTQPAEAVGS